MLKHNALSAIQRIPFFSAGAGTLLCIALAFDDSMDIARLIFEIGVITSGFYIIYVFSIYLGFCAFQRIGIYYTYIVFICVWLRRYPDGYSGWFGQYLDEAHSVMSLVGVLYLCLFAYRQAHRCHGCSKNQKDAEQHAPHPKS